MTSICPSILTPSYDTLHEGASQCTLFLYFDVKKKKKEKKTIKEPKKKCKKVNRKPENVVYAKREPKEREREKTQKVDQKLKRAVYAKGE